MLVNIKYCTISLYSDMVNCTAACDSLVNKATAAWASLLVSICQGGVRRKGCKPLPGWRTESGAPLRPGKRMVGVSGDR